MPEAQAPEAEFTSTSLSPTDEELAVMMELKAEQEQLLETRAFYRSLINFLCNDFNNAYNENCELRQKSDNLFAELVKTAVELGFEMPEEHKSTQSTSAKAAGSIEDFLLRMLKAPGSETVTSGDLPSGFPCITPYTDSEPHMGAAGCDSPNYTADDFSLRERAMRTAANVTVGAGFTSRMLSLVESSGVNTSVEICSKAAPCALPNITEQNVARSAQNRRPDECNHSSKRNPICIPIPQRATKAANTLPAEPKTNPRLKTCTGAERLAGPKPESSQMKDTMEPLSPSAWECALVQRQVEVCQSPLLHQPGSCCDSLPVVSPLQSLAKHTKTTPDSQGECSFTVEEHLHPVPALETAGTLSESSPSASTTSSIGGATTLVVRNIPAKYSKDMLLQEMPPDGTYDFFIFHSASKR